MPPLTLIRFQVEPIGNLKMFYRARNCFRHGFSGMTTRLTRTMMLEVMRQDYIRTALVKRVRERTVCHQACIEKRVNNPLLP